MADYRFLAADLMTNELLEELPLSGVSYSHVLNGAGDIGGGLQLGARKDDGTLLDRFYLNAIGAGAPGSHLPPRALYVERGGLLTWGGILWNPQPYDSSSPVVPIAGAEFWSYYHRRRLSVNKVYLNTDQLAIARDLMSSVATNGPTVLLDATTSGVLRSRTQWLGAYERPKIAELIENMAGAVDGFDFAIDVTLEADVPTRRFNLSYPRRGRLASTSSLVFELGKNVAGYRFTYAHDRSVNYEHALGDGDGELMLRTSSLRNDVLSAGWPMLEGVTSYRGQGITNLATLAQHAAAVTATRGTPISIVELDVDDVPGTDTPVGSWIVGDEVRFRADDERFPDGLDVVLRIIGDRFTVDDDGTETITLTCAELLNA